MTAAHIPGGMTPVLLFFLFLNAVALRVGQRLFKSIGVIGLPFAAMVAKIANVPSFYAACLLYAAATVLWVWILTKLPLSTRGPVRRDRRVFFGETPSIRGWIGVLMVAAGVALVASSAGAKF